MKKHLTSLKSIKVFSLIFLSTIMFSSCSDIFIGGLLIASGVISLLMGLLKIVIILCAIAVIGSLIAKFFKD